MFGAQEQRMSEGIQRYSVKLWKEPNIQVPEACISPKKKEAKNSSFLQSRLPVALLSYFCHNAKSGFPVMSEEDKLSRN